MSENPDKHFYKVGEVCKATDTQPYVLRFWESEFPQLAPNKNRTGQRVYTREDVRTILQIKKLLYEQEYTIADARRALDSIALDDPASPAALDQSSARPGEQREEREEREQRELREQGDLWTDVLPEDTHPQGSADAPRDAEQTPAPVESRPSHAELGALRARVETLEERCRLAEGALEAADAERNALRARAEQVAGRLERLLASLSRGSDAKDGSGAKEAGRDGSARSS